MASPLYFTTGADDSKGLLDSGPHRAGQFVVCRDGDRSTDQMRLVVRGTGRQVMTAR
jgi:hypothetical protein